jgi:hypothetical protein
MCSFVYYTSLLHTVEYIYLGCHGRSVDHCYTSPSHCGQIAEQVCLPAPSRHSNAEKPNIKMSSQDAANSAMVENETIESSNRTTAASSSLRSFFSQFTTPKQSSRSGDTLPDPEDNQVISVKLYQKPTGSSGSSSPSPEQVLLDVEVLNQLSKLFNGSETATAASLEGSPLTIAWWQEARVGRAPVYLLCLGREDLENSVRHEKKGIDENVFGMLSKGLHRGLEKWEVKRGQESWTMSTGPVENVFQLSGTDDRAVDLQTVACELKKKK